MLKEILVEDETKESLTFQRGWRQRPNQGETLVINTVFVYRSKILEICKHENTQGAKKMSPSEIH